nr:MAG TPA: hypothetical protein [Caudoviricetes sp.]
MGGGALCRPSQSAALTAPPRGEPRNGGTAAPTKDV